MTSILQHALWPSLTLAMLILWTFGVVDIDRHRRRGTSTRARLVCMTGCVSLVAIFAIAGIGAAFAGPWTETVATVGPDGRELGELQNPARSPVFSFGLENASYAPDDSTGEGGNGAPR